MLGAGACLLEALDSGRGEGGGCTFIAAIGAWVGGGAMLEFWTMGNVEEESVLDLKLPAWSLSG